MGARDWRVWESSRRRSSAWHAIQGMAFSTEAAALAAARRNWPNGEMLLTGSVVGVGPVRGRPVIPLTEYDKLENTPSGGETGGVQ